MQQRQLSVIKVMIFLTVIGCISVAKAISVRDSTWMSAMPLNSVECLLAPMQVTTSLSDWYQLYISCQNNTEIAITLSN